MRMKQGTGYHVEKCRRVVYTRTNKKCIIVRKSEDSISSIVASKGVKGLGLLSIQKCKRITIERSDNGADVYQILS